jgi:cytidyltransferase-like protein
MAYEYKWPKFTFEYKGPCKQYEDSPKTIVIVSGYFNPWHKGHEAYLTAAKKLGDKLWVIVNNDAQQILKKGRVIRNNDERVRMVEEIGLADEIILSIDKDPSQCGTLEAIVKNNPGNRFIFANGGDRNAGNIPETPTCRYHHIEMIDGVGGGKIASSTDINIGLGLEQPKSK